MYGGIKLEIQEIANLYFYLLIASALICAVVGYLITKKTKDHGKGFSVLFLLSFLCLIIIIIWFDQASRSNFMGTIPWLFNIVCAIIVYPIYLFLTLIVYKRVHKISRVNL